MFSNYSFTGANTPTGAPQTITINFNATNVSGSNSNFNAYLVTLKSGSVPPAGRVKHRVIQDAWKLRDRRREPILIGAMLPIWLRRKDLDAKPA
jgi:hypothetical protein